MTRQMALDYLKARAAIEAAVQSEADLTETETHDVAFHMTDWLEDLEALYEMYQQPERYSAKEIKDVLLGFLVHVPNHVAAAAKLLTGNGISDIFGVGAVETVEEE